MHVFCFTPCVSLPQYLQTVAPCVAREYIMTATTPPYKPSTSAKMRMSTMPTYSRGCCVLARTGI